MTQPAIPVGEYAMALLTFIYTALETILPFAGAVFVLVISTNMIRTWLGHRSANSIAPNYDDDEFVAWARKRGVSEEAIRDQNVWRRERRARGL